MLYYFPGALKWIRNLFPSATITLAIKNHIINLLELCPHVDNIIAWEHLSGEEWRQKVPIRVLWRGPAFLSRIFITRRFLQDLVIVPLKSPGSGFFGLHGVVKDIPASRKVGIRGDYNNQTPEEDALAESIYSCRMPLLEEDRWVHELVIAKKFLTFLGTEPLNEGDLWPEFWTEAADRDFAALKIPKEFDELTIGIFSEASAKIREWPGERFAEAIQLLKLNTSKRLRIVIFGSNRHDQSVIKELEILKREVAVTDLRGLTTLRQLVECIRRCDALFGVDTAGIHMGVALGKPTVGIMTGGHFGRFYPWGNPDINRACLHYLPCYRCNWHCPHEAPRCMQEIGPQIVARELGIALKNAGYDIDISQQERDESEHQMNLLNNYLEEGSIKLRTFKVKN